MGAVRLRWLTLVLPVALGLAGPGRAAGAVENPAPPGPEVVEALRSLGPPGLLWGRLAVEEESPDGAWTPLNGVDVRVYLATPPLLSEIERIRQSARQSRTQYDTAVARFQAALSAHEAQIEAAGGIPGSTDPAQAVQKKGWGRVTDPAGIFVFPDLPAGEWLLVAVRVTPYGSATARLDARRRVQPREPRFLPRSTDPPREAEVWATRIRVGPGERVAVFLTDRARWLVGPVR